MKVKKWIDTLMQYDMYKVSTIPSTIWWETLLPVVYKPNFSFSGSNFM